MNARLIVAILAALLGGCAIVPVGYDDGYYYRDRHYYRGDRYDRDGYYRRDRYWWNRGDDDGGWRYRGSQYDDRYRRDYWGGSFRYFDHGQ
jgi:hypothetical protein